MNIKVIDHFGFVFAIPMDGTLENVKEILQRYSRRSMSDDNERPVDRMLRLLRAGLKSAEDLRRRNVKMGRGEARECLEMLDGIRRAVEDRGRRRLLWVGLGVAAVCLLCLVKVH